jgi:hypothetical protein
MQSTFKKVVIGQLVTALKQQKSEGEGEEKEKEDIVHLMKPITRSPDSGQNDKIYSEENVTSSNNRGFLYALTATSTIRGNEESIIVR